MFVWFFSQRSSFFFWTWPEGADLSSGKRISHKGVPNLCSGTNLLFSAWFCFCVQSTDWICPWLLFLRSWHWSRTSLSLWLPWWMASQQRPAASWWPAVTLFLQRKSPRLLHQVLTWVYFVPRLLWPSAELCQERSEEELRRANVVGKGSCYDFGTLANLAVDSLLF